MPSGEQYRPHVFTGFEGRKDKNTGELVCDVCFEIIDEGDHVTTEFLMSITAPRGGLQYPKKTDPEQPHEFKLAFGEFYCSVCKQLPTAAIHQGIDLESRTPRPVRELEDPLTDEEFWEKVAVKEGLKPSFLEEIKKTLNIKSPAAEASKDGETLAQNKVDVDKMIEEANEDNYARTIFEKGPGHDIQPKKRSALTLGDKIVLGSLGSGLAVNLAVSIWNMFN